MTTFKVTRRSVVATFAGLVCAPISLNARSIFPDRPVRLVVPLAPGGAVDRLARLLAEKLASHWGVPVIVENRAGGGIVVGTLAVARAPADGYTLGLVGSGLSITASQPSERQFELKDIKPISRIGFFTEALLATPSCPSNDIKSLIAYAKSRPASSIPYGSNGIGSSAELAGEMLNQMAGIQLQHIPYNGAARMYAEMLGGQIPLGIGVLSSARPYLASRQMKVLAVTSARRSGQFPELAAVSETLPGFEAGNWAGIIGPAALPAAVTAKLARDIQAALQDQQLQSAIAEMGVELAPQAAEEFDSFVKNEVNRFSKLQATMATRKRSS